MTERQLRPCPFCGADDGLHAQFLDFGMWAVKCDVCGASGPIEVGEAKAAGEWNERADAE